jgi:hypothetical protein
MKKLDRLINEVQAEIVGNKIPGHKIFDNRGNMTGDEFKGSLSEKVLAKIFQAINKAGLMSLFSPDKGDLDIKPGKVLDGKGINTEYILTPDVGDDKYKYIVSTGKVVKVYTQEIPKGKEKDK